MLCATLGENFVEVARWGQKKLEFLRCLLPHERGIASHHTLNDEASGSVIRTFLCLPVFRLSRSAVTPSSFASATA